MINRTCGVCGEYVQDVWTLSIKDDKEVKEYSGHLNCISKLQKRVNSIKNVRELSVQETIKKLNKDLFKNN